MEIFDKEYNYLFNKFFGNSEIIGNPRKLKDKEVEEVEALINGVEYTGYNYSYGNVVFVPKGINLKGDFAPVYLLGKSSIGFHFSIVSKTNGLLEEKLYYLNKRPYDTEKTIETMYDYSSYQDNNNELLKVFEQENMSIDLFMIARKYSSVIRENHKFFKVMINKYEEKVERLILNGTRTEVFKKFVSGIDLYESIDIGDKTMFESIDELLEIENEKVKKKI